MPLHRNDYFQKRKLHRTPFRGLLQRCLGVAATPEVNSLKRLALALPRCATGVILQHLSSLQHWLQHAPVPPGSSCVCKENSRSSGRRSRLCFLYLRPHKEVTATSQGSKSLFCLPFLPLPFVRASLLTLCLGCPLWSVGIDAFFRSKLCCFAREQLFLS